MLRISSTSFGPQLRLRLSSELDSSSKIVIALLRLKHAQPMKNWCKLRPWIWSILLHHIPTNTKMQYSASGLESTSFARKPLPSVPHKLKSSRKRPRRRNSSLWKRSGPGSFLYPKLRTAHQLHPYCSPPCASRRSATATHCARTDQIYSTCTCAGKSVRAEKQRSVWRDRTVETKHAIECASSPENVSWGLPR